MLPISSTLYARWRSGLRESDATLHEGGAPLPPSERLVQAIWQHQRICRDKLTTSDARAVRVLHPGFLNREAGPDFLQAIIQIGEEAAVSGDIEVDLAARGWRDHGHHDNPAYRNVILHVVWSASAKSPHPLPILSLERVLDAPLADLAQSLNTEEAGPDRPGLTGKCCAPLRDRSVGELGEILRQAALFRLQSKAAHFEARARQVGWEQSLWEGLFASLGYKHNAWPMRRLAELLPNLGAQTEISRDHWQARLLGLSGLLPSELPRREETSDYVQRLWSMWWRERDTWRTVTLPRAAWRLGGLRPVNHPQRRLGLVADWLARPDFVKRLEAWCAMSLADDELDVTLVKIMQAAEEDVFWLRHCTLDSKPLPSPQQLIGLARVGEIAMNVLLPWFWVRAVAGGNERLRLLAEHRYFAWPKGEDNAVLRLARQRLFGPEGTGAIRTAAAQQGLLQVVRDFCEQSNALCERCRFPDLVKAFGS